MDTFFYLKCCKHSLLSVYVWTILSWSNPIYAQPTSSYTIYGPSEIDLSACSPEGPTGSSSASFWVIRAPTITGPAQIHFNNLPSDVKVQISPQTITFPGWAIGEKIDVTFVANAGVQVADGIVELNVSDGIHTISYEIILHGTCPRHNKDFTIRGSFFSNNLGVIFPIEGATVQIYRDVVWQTDQLVGSSKTNIDGSFEAQLWADDEDVYYAKLMLNDQEGVYLRDWWTSEIKSYNSVNRGSNKNPVIDLGNTVISSDNGSGTPRSSIWQGGRAAFQEFISTTGNTPPTGNYEIVMQNTVTQMTWTARSTTNWEVGTDTYNFSSGKPIGPLDTAFHRYFSQFLNYSTNFHEFGHALRHTVDGDQTHFTNDASRWTYGRTHGICGSAAGYIETEAFGFNEGWAEYWSNYNRETILVNCPTIKIHDFTIEGSVAIDLITLAQSLNLCLPIIGNRESIARGQRRAMFTVLNRGQNIIHSEGEFRNHFALQFPMCPLPVVGAGLLVTRAGLKQRSYSLKKFKEQYALLIRNQKTISAELKAEWQVASRRSRDVGDCSTLNCDTVISKLVSPVVINGKIKYSDLLLKRFEQKFESLQKQKDAAYSEEVALTDSKQLQVFDKELRKIILSTLKECISTLDPYAKKDKTGKIRLAYSDLTRKMKMLQIQSPLNDDLYVVLELPAISTDERISSIR